MRVVNKEKTDTKKKKVDLLKFLFEIRQAHISVAEIYLYIPQLTLAASKLWNIQKLIFRIFLIDIKFKNSLLKR